MRVAFLGNIANVHFRLARLLRERGGLDAHLFVPDTAAPAWRPETDDPSLAGNYPDWIHPGPWVTPRSILWPAGSPIARELAAFDLVIASGVGPMFAQHAGPPWAFLVTGGDLTVKPFPITFWDWYPSLLRRLAHVPAGWHQRAAIRRADRILTQPFAPMVDALDRLDVPDGPRSEQYFPLPVDTDRYSPDGPVADDLPEGDFVVFHPSRVVLDDSPRMRRTGQWKGNDILFRGFARFVAEGVVDRARLVMVDQPASRDRDEAHRLLDDLGLHEHVEWIRPADGTMLTQPEMAAWYRRADVVAVEFGIGWFGYVALEGAACGRPVLCHVEGSVMDQLYPWHPIQDAADDVQVARRLAELASSAGHRREVGERSRRWIEEFHGPDVVANRYLVEFERLASDLVGSGA